MIKRDYNVRANVIVGRDVYKQQGTTFPTRLLIIDKTGATKNTVTGEAETLADLVTMLEGVRNDRTQPRPAEPTVSDVTVEGESETDGIVPVRDGTDAVEATGRPRRTGPGGVLVGSPPSETDRHGVRTGPQPDQQGTGDEGLPDSGRGDVRGRPGRDSPGAVDGRGTDAGDAGLAADRPDAHGAGRERGDAGVDIEQEMADITDEEIDAMFDELEAEAASAAAPEPEVAPEVETAPEPERIGVYTMLETEAEAAPEPEMSFEPDVDPVELHRQIRDAIENAPFAEDLAYEGFGPSIDTAFEDAILRYFLGMDLQPEQQHLFPDLQHQPVYDVVNPSKPR